MTDEQYLARTNTRRTHYCVVSERERCALACEVVRDVFGADEIRSRYVAQTCANTIRGLAS